MADPVPERPYGMKGKTYVLSILYPKKIGLFGVHRTRWHVMTGVRVCEASKSEKNP